MSASNLTIAETREAALEAERKAYDAALFARFVAEYAEGDPRLESSTARAIECADLAEGLARLIEATRDSGEATAQTLGALRRQARVAREAADRAAEAVAALR